MPRTPVLKQYVALSHIEGILLGLLNRIGRVRLTGLLHDEQHALTALYTNIEKERHAIIALLDEYPRRIRRS